MVAVWPRVPETSIEICLILRVHWRVRWRDPRVVGVVSPKDKSIGPRQFFFSIKLSNSSVAFEQSYKLVVFHKISLEHSIRNFKHD